MIIIIRLTKWEHSSTFSLAWNLSVFSQLAVWLSIKEKASCFWKSQFCQVSRGVKGVSSTEVRETKRGEKAERVANRDEMAALWSKPDDCSHWVLTSCIGKQHILLVLHNAQAKCHTCGHPQPLSLFCALPLGAYTHCESFEYTWQMCLHLILCRSHLEIRVLSLIGETVNKGMCWLTRLTHALTASASGHRHTDPCAHEVLEKSYTFPF